MLNKTSSKDNSSLLKQGLILILVLLAIPCTFFSVFFFPLLKSEPEKEAISPAQALTMVAQMSQTARAMGTVPSDDDKAAQPTQVSPRNTVGATKPRQSFSSPVPGTRTPTPTRVSKSVATSTRGNSSSYTSNNYYPTSPKDDPNATATFPVANVTIRPTYTPKPTGTPTPTPSPTPTPTPTATPSPGLPGLSMSNVIARFQNEKNFTCKQEAGSTGIVLWMCDLQSGNDLWYHVDIYGTSTVGVYNLLVSVFQTYPEDEKAIDIIGFAASLPYNGSNASKARQWVKDTLPGIESVEDVNETFIGGVRFKLYGGPQGRYLEMGDPVQQQ